MQSYTQNFLKKKEKNPDDIDTDLETPTFDEEFPSEYYEYSLKGVVIHIGTADSGHYYSIINEKDDKWLEFNDIHVRKFDINDLSSEAFGGDEKGLSNSGNNMMNLSKSMKERSKNGYLLFYERTRKYTENAEEISQLIVPENSAISPRIYEEIKDDNVKYYINKNCFDSEFSLFIQKLLLKTIENVKFDEISLEIYKLSFLYFFSVVIRFKDRERLIPVMTKLLKKSLVNSVEISAWFLTHAGSEEIIKETLIECPIKDIKYIVSGLYIEGIKRISDEKREIFMKIVDLCMFLLVESKERKLMDVFYRLFTCFSRCSKSFKGYLLEKKTISLLFYYISEQSFPVDLVLPKVLPIENNELAVFTQEKKGFLIRSIEEIVEKKKEKSLLENVTINYSNLIIAFSNLICSIPLSEKTVKNTINSLVFEPITDYKLENDEKKMIFSPIFWKKLLVESQNKTVFKPICRFFCYLSFSNKQMNLEIIKVLLEELAGNDENSKVFLKVLEALILLEDEYRVSRAKYIIEKIMVIFKENLKFYKISNQILEFLYKICGRNTWILKGFAEYFSENKSMLRMVEEWIKSLKDLSYHLNSGNYQIYRRKKATFNTQILQICNFL